MSSSKIMIIVAAFMMGMTFAYINAEDDYGWFIDVDMVITTPQQQTTIEEKE